MTERSRRSLNRRARRGLRAAIVATGGLLLSSCAHTLVDRVPMLSPGSTSYLVSTQADVLACADSVALHKPETGAALDTTDIRVVNWNIRKRRHPDLSTDLAVLSADKDLVLIQEASLREDTINSVDATRHWSFVPGYRMGGEIMGTMTLSKVAPLTQCSLVVLEPILRTPKTTSITEYALSDTDQTLVVVNMHAVNISLGLEAFQRQFDQVAQVLATHAGPVILSGDFNTWRQRRTEIVEALTDSLHLRSVEFDDDKRVRIFGHALDHIYVRGLSTTVANTEVVRTSDHNPMSVTLAMDRAEVMAD